jgi:hypothetical protein
MNGQMQKYQRLTPCHVTEPLENFLAALLIVAAKKIFSNFKRSNGARSNISISSSVVDIYKHGEEGKQAASQTDAH